MGRKPKMTRGQTRTVLMRSYQIQQVADLSERLGCDFSDMVRGTLDLMFPIPVDELRQRTMAAIERNRRRLAEVDESLLDVLLSGWSGKEMYFPHSVLRHPELAALLEETAAMLRCLDSAVTREPHHPVTLPTEHYRGADENLLVLLCSPAVRIVEYDRHSRPTVILTAHVIVPPGVIGKRSRNRSEDSVSPLGCGSLELQYEEPMRALAILVHSKAVTEVTDEYLGRVSVVLKASAYRIAWDASARRREMGLGTEAEHQREMGL